MLESSERQREREMGERERDSSIQCLSKIECTGEGETGRGREGIRRANMGVLSEGMCVLHVGEGRRERA